MKREPFKPGEHEWCAWSVQGGDEVTRHAEYTRKRIEMVRLGYVVHAVSDTPGGLSVTFRRKDVQPDAETETKPE